MNAGKCTKCDDKKPEKDLVVLKFPRKQEVYCPGCLDTWITKESRLSLDHPKIPAMTFIDLDNKARTFEFDLRRNYEGIGIKATEARRKKGEGHRCFGQGEIAADARLILRALIKRLRKELWRKHLVREAELSPGFSVKGNKVRGRLDYDVDSMDGNPCVVVDGKKFEWGAFGRILLEYEGWNFFLEFVDSTDDV